MLSRLADFIIRHRILVIAFVVLATLSLGYSVLKIKLNADFSTYLSQGDPLVKEFNRISEVFKANYVGMVLLRVNDVFTADNLQLIARLTQAYEALDVVDSVTSLVNAIDFRKVGNGLIVSELLEG